MTEYKGTAVAQRGHAEASQTGTGIEAEQAAVNFVGVAHRFGENTVVDDLNLDIGQGEIFGLLGPNGVGKTTTIRLLTTLLPLQQGSIRVFDVDVSTYPMTARHNIGYVPQQLSIDKDLTAGENVSWFARLYDVPRREVRQRVHDSLASVSLLDVIDEVSSKFSGGMTRRLELAQALVARPRMLVLDEPTVGLDPLARDSVWEHVRRLKEQDGMTVLLTTHYMEEADMLCDRVGLMSHGKLQALGSPQALKAQIGPEATLEDVFRAFSGHGLGGED